MRRKAAQKRVMLPDPLFRSELIAKFITSVMRHGKKSLAERIVYGALENVVQQSKPTKAKEDKGEDGGEGGSSGKGDSTAFGSIRTDLKAREFAVEIFQKALANVSPMVEVKSRRVGGSTYQVPVEVRPQRKRALGMRWLVEYASARSESTMEKRLASELLDASQRRGNAVKKCEDVHRMAEANKVFAHYRW